MQILAERGVTVVGTARPENHGYLRGLGAIPIEYGERLLEQLAAVEFPLTELTAAWKMNEEGHFRGKIVVKVADLD